MTRNFMAGVAANFELLQNEDLQTIREAGIDWLRSEIKQFDQKAFLDGRSQPEEFYKNKRKIAELRKMGFQVMGLTPSPHRIIPEAGQPGSQKYYDNNRKMCAFLGHEFLGLIDYWQVANEVDIWIFRDSLTIEQAAEFLKSGLRGLKEADKKLKVGINITLFPSKP